MLLFLSVQKRIITKRIDQLKYQSLYSDTVNERAQESWAGTKAHNTPALEHWLHFAGRSLNSITSTQDQIIIIKKIKKIFFFSPQKKSCWYELEGTV